MAQSQASPSTAAAPPRTEPAAGTSEWPAGRIAALSIGVLLALVALCLLAGAGAGLWFDQTQRSGGYVTSDAHAFSTSGSALATKRANLGSWGIGWLYSPSVLEKVRIRVTPVNPESQLFVGIGPSDDVDRYLAGVSQTVITDFWDSKSHAVEGSAPRSLPGAQHFWVASSAGPGARTVKWDPAKGSWTVVVMNANGRPGVDVRADLGAKVPYLLWIAIGFLAAGAVLLAGGGFLIVGAIRRGRVGPVT